MHICFNGWFWDQQFTGSGQYTRRLISGLQRIDPSLRLSIVLPSWVQADDLPSGVEAIRVKSGRGDVAKVQFEQSGFPSAVGKLKPDLAHIPYWGNPLSSPVPQIVTVHDVIPLSMPEYRGGWRQKLYFSLVTAAARGATHILTDSAFSKQEIIDRIGIGAEDITVVHLAQGGEFHNRIGAERDEEVRARYDLPDEFTLYLGGFDVRKNLLALVAAYSFVGPALDETPLILAGKPPVEWGTPQFPDLPSAIAAKEGLDKFIRFIGAVDEADKPSLYRLAGVFAYPTRYEGFGLGVLEAMACGTPVVAANASSIPEIAGEAGYLVDPDDSRAIGGAIIGSHIKENLRQGLINDGLARASQFSWEKTARETLKVYQHFAR